MKTVNMQLRKARGFVCAALCAAACLALPSTAYMAQGVDVTHNEDNTHSSDDTHSAENAYGVGDTHSEDNAYGEPGGNGAATPSPFFIYVEKGSFSITVFYLDDEGNYSIPLRTFPTAIGRSSRMTPTGTFEKGSTELWHNWGRTYSPYTSEYYTNLYVHGPIYSRQSFDSLNPGTASQIGSAVSSGCLRTTAEAAYFFYEFCPEGTLINIVDGSPIGYYAPAVSVEEQYRDPAGMTLADIFPGSPLFASAPEQDESGWRSGRATLWDEDAHFAWQKKDANLGMCVVIDSESLELTYGGDDEVSVSGGDSGAGVGEDVSAGVGEGVGEDEADVSMPRLTARFVADTTAADAAYSANAYTGDGAILWVSSDTRVVAVDADGYVYCKGPGSANIVALGPDGYTSAICHINVQQAHGRGQADKAAPFTGLAAASPESEREKEALRNVAEGAFPDLADGHWAAEAIGRLNRLGAIEGSGKRFGPDDDVTKAEFIKMLVLATRVSKNGGADASADADAYTARRARRSDVIYGSDNDGSNGGDDDMSWIGPYLDEAVKLGIMDGPEMHVIMQDPDDYLTREELCLWAGKAFGFRLSSPDVYEDCEGFQCPLTARRLVSRMYFNGYSGGKFYPDAFVTRALAVQTLSNLIIDQYLA
ncbi:MAG: S-layer homology domain-containing protein [Oscillospiraceae bacterium]|nr:S-layer homology domain-containing protein [Oscillospiraceae bacterium]